METTTPANKRKAKTAAKGGKPNSDPASHLQSESIPKDAIPALTVDNLIFGFEEGRLKVLLVKHGTGLSEGEWGLPGGWVKYSESLEDAAKRVLFDLSGVQDVYLEQLQMFSEVDRYPAARVISAAFYALVRVDRYQVVAGRIAADAAWFDIKKVPKLIFDHPEILATGIGFLKHKVRHEPIGFNLLPEKFTLLELQKLYEAILDTQLDKPNFRRKMAKMNLLVPCNEKQRGVAHRAANLYRFDLKIYKKLIKQGFTFEV